MKKILLIIMLLVGFLAKSESQINCYLGFQSGLSISNTQWENKWNYNQIGIDTSINFNIENKIGYSNNIQLEFINKKHLSLISSLGFRQNSFSVIPDFLYWNGWPDTKPRIYNYKITYLPINLLLKGKVPINKYNLYSAVGPSIDFFISDDTEFETKNGLTYINYGFDYSIGLEYSICKLKVSFEYIKSYYFEKVVQYLETTSYLEFNVNIDQSPHSFMVGFAYRIN